MSHGFDRLLVPVGGGIHRAQIEVVDRGPPWSIDGGGVFVGLVGCLRVALEAVGVSKSLPPLGVPPEHRHCSPVSSGHL